MCIQFGARGRERWRGRPWGLVSALTRGNLELGWGCLGGRREAIGAQVLQGVGDKWGQCGQKEYQFLASYIF